MKTSIRLGVLAILFLTPTTSHAHGLMMGNGVWSGLAHPLGGWDHLLAMVAVGLLSTRHGSLGLWVMPGLFLAGMIAGSSMGFLGVVFPGTEWVVLASVGIFGLVLVSPRSVPWLAVAPMVVLFGFSHGHAHGLELPAQTNPIWFSTGFLMSSASLHLVGLFLGKIIAGSDQERLLMQTIGVGLGVFTTAKVLVDWPLI